MDADDYKPAVPVFRIEPGDVRQRVDAVDAAVGPEIHQHHLAAQIRDVERRGIEPVADAGEIGRCALRRGDRERNGLAARRLAADARQGGADQAEGNYGSGCGERAYRHGRLLWSRIDYKPTWPFA